jgi:tetratricopeptide (TPR) repeat protein
MDAKSYLGTAYYNIGEYEKAIPLLKEIIECESPDFIPNVLVSIVYVNSLFGAQNYDEAIIVIEKKLKEFPQEGFFDKTLGDVYLAKGDTITAKIKFSTALQKGSEITETLVFLEIMLDTYKILNDLEGQIACWKSVATVSPNSSSIYLDLLRLYSKNYILYANEIIETFDKLIEINHKNKEVVAYFMATKAMSLLSSGQFESSLSTINKAIEIHSFGEYYATRAFIFVYEELFALQNGTKDEVSKEIQEKILKDIEIATQSNLRKKETYLFKTSVLIIFNRNKEACKALNEAIAQGAVVNKKQIDQICKSKDSTPIEWDFNYELPTLYDLFDNDVLVE